LGPHANNAELVGLCDTNQVRMDYTNKVIADEYGGAKLPTYAPDQFGQMLSDTKAETVIVTSIDRTHHRYIIAALEAGRDVITEKPMTTDAAKCQEIIDA
jgi:predicted dehydrogenase